MHSYPRLCLLCISFAAAYVLYHVGAFDWMNYINGYGYLSIFIGGVLFSFGFTTPFALAIFAEMATHTHPFIAAPIAGMGALLSDILIFDLIRYSIFHSEIERLRSSRLVMRIHALIHHENISERMRRMILWSFAGIIIASPLPDEFGVSLVSSITHIQPRQFALLCFCLNTAGVLLILLGARALT